MPELSLPTHVALNISPSSESSHREIPTVNEAAWDHLLPPQSTLQQPEVNLATLQTGMPVKLAEVNVRRRKQFNSQPNPKKPGQWKKLLWVKQDCMPNYSYLR